MQDKTKEEAKKIHKNNGQNIRILRTQRKRSMTKFAGMFNLTRGTISQIENGLNGPTFINLRRYADCLGVTIDDLTSPVLKADTLTSYLHKRKKI